MDEIIYIYYDTHQSIEICVMQVLRLKGYEWYYTFFLKEMQEHLSL
jgi:hypothetical protein